MKYTNSVHFAGHVMCFLANILVYTCFYFEKDPISLISNTAISIQLHTSFSSIYGSVFVAFASSISMMLFWINPESPQYIHLTIIEQPNSITFIFLDFIVWLTLLCFLNELSHRKLQNSLETANKHKTDFVARMSHELRTPLFGIVGCLEMIEPKIESEEKAIIEIAQTCCKNLMGLIDDILDVAKIESGHIELKMNIVNSASVIDDSIKVISNQASKKHITVKQIIKEGLPKYFIGDVTRLKQVIINLLMNAVKFTNEHGTIRFSIAHIERYVQPFAKNVYFPLSNYKKYPYPSNGYLQFSVTDNGIGLTKADMQRVFNAFEQADISTSRRFGGSGLGLTISLHLVSEMGGFFAVYSDGKGKGTTFEFVIPFFKPFPNSPKLSAAGNISQSEPIIIPYKKKIKRPKLPTSATTTDDISQCRSISEGKLLVTNHEIVVETKSRKNKHKTDKNEDIQDEESRILVVEDNKVNQTILKKMLQRLGYSADIAEDGTQAIEILRKKRNYDIIFMDIEMPILDGISCTIKLRKELKIDIPIIALSAHALVELKKQIMDAGMDDFITKPTTTKSLELVLKRWINLRRDLGDN